MHPIILRLSKGSLGWFCFSLIVGFSFLWSLPMTKSMTEVSDSKPQTPFVSISKEAKGQTTFCSKESIWRKT